MKEGEVPEKIYVALNELTEDGHTLVLDHRVDYPICTEYTRTDAFIEKACEWLNTFYSEKTRSYLIDEDIQKFKNYMKGE